MRENACDDGHRHAGPAAARSADLGHRSLQLPLRLLHAQGGLRARLRVPRARRAADVRGDRAAGADLRRRPWGEQDPPDRRRAARAPRAGAARRDARADPRARGPGHDHQRLGAGAQGAGARGRRAAPDHRQPRLPRRRGVRARSTTSASRSTRVLAGIEAAAAAGLGPIKINMVVKRGVNERQRSADGPPLPRQRPHRALHRVHGRRPQQRLADGRRRAGGGDRRDDRRRDGRSSRSRRTTPARSSSAGATATAAARSA